VGQRGEAVDAALTGGVGSTVRPIRFSNRIKSNQIYFKRIQICPKLTDPKVPSCAPKFSNKNMDRKSFG
jgi:hypothetical protein